MNLNWSNAERFRCFKAIEVYKKEGIQSIPNNFQVRLANSVSSFLAKIYILIPYKNVVLLINSD